MAWTPSQDRNGKTLVRRAPVKGDKTPLDTTLGQLQAHKLLYRIDQKDRRKGHHKTQDLALAVERAVGLGLTQPQIAYLMGIHTNTLVKHYREELDMGGAVLHGAIASQLAAIALDVTDKRCVDAAKFILARKFGWKEQIDLDGGTVNIQQNVIDARALSPEDRGSLKDLLVQALNGAQPQLADQRVLDAEFDEVEFAEVEYDDAEDLL